ncbi:hypothetical protein [Alteromonas sp. 14N.309.X.WAT.G.H12]|uniref:hypothetical protein n=1 Tax=Alteromonas sp. 14N.309.X.WAT.G.H12 TaxID=3120824 RepID=UPI002FD44B18
MSKLKLLHGSNALPAYPEMFGFKLFNYRLDPNKPQEISHINNGYDSYGPGVYAFPMTEVSLDLYNKIKGYCGHEGEGSVIGFSLDTEDAYTEQRLHPANEIPLENVDVSDWVNAVGAFWDALSKEQGVDESELENDIEAIYSLWEGAVSQDDIDHQFAALREKYPSLDLCEGIPSNFEDADHWRDEVISMTQASVPLSHLREEFGFPEGVVDYAMSKSDNVWEMMVQIYFSIAVNNTGLGMESWNGLFHEVMIRELSEESVNQITYANVNLDEDGQKTEYSFCVVFATHKIEVDVIEQRRYPMEQSVFDTLIEHVRDVLEEYEGVGLTREQLITKVEDAGVPVFGRPLTKPIAKLLINSPQNDVHTRRAIRTGMVEPEFTLWERAPGMANTYALPDREPATNLRMKEPELRRKRN